MKGCPTETDWEHARSMLPFLKAFYDSTLRISGSLYVTSNDYFHDMFGIGMRINDNLYKMDYATFVIEEVYEYDKAEQLCAIVLKILNDLFQYYPPVSGTLHEESNASSQSNVSTIETKEFVDMVAYSKSKYKRKRAESRVIEGKSELERYLEDKVESDDNKFDILGWWKNNANSYLVHALIARDILVVPVSTVALESAFSTKGCVLDLSRSSLTPKIVECLICAQNWIRSSHVPIQKEETIEDLEDIESVERDLSLVKELGLELIYAINTHVHADHVTITCPIKTKVLGVNSIISKASNSKTDILLEAGDNGN
ncbi:hypothetical protein REPUB_Repub12eG0043500 [Reevesia pubescens]